MIKTLLRKFYVWKDERAERLAKERDKYYACANRHCIHNLDDDTCYNPAGFRQCHKYEWQQERKRKGREKVGLM